MSALPAQRVTVSTPHCLLCLLVLRICEAQGSTVGKKGFRVKTEVKKRAPFFPNLGRTILLVNLAHPTHHPGPPTYSTSHLSSLIGRGPTSACWHPRTLTPPPHPLSSLIRRGPTSTCWHPRTLTPPPHPLSSLIRRGPTSAC